MKLMLAGKADPTKLKFPLLASPKLDGIRAVVKDGVVLSRNMKPIPNGTVQRMFGREEYDGLDGELIVGSPTDPACFRNTTSGVMSEEGTPLVQFHVFDRVPQGMQVKGWQPEPFVSRFERLRQWIRKRRPSGVILVPHVPILTAAMLESYEMSQLAAGYEGVMVRDPDGPYKHGRSTVNEGWLLKLKRFEDGEAKVIGVEEQMHNANEAKRNAAGKLERSSKKSGKVPTGVLGALLVRDMKTGVDFSIGTGFSDAERAELWRNPPRPGTIVRYRYFPSGSRERPRFPVFAGFRDPRDMG